MSTLRATRSFSLIATGKLTTRRKIADFVFPFDASDVAMMFGSIEKLSEMGGVQGVACALRSDLKDGLYEDELHDDPHLDTRKEKWGVNMIEKPPLKSFWRWCWEGIHDPMLMILLIAGALSMGVGFVHDLNSGWIEGVAVMLAVVLVTTVGAFNNLQQEKAFRELDESKAEEKFQVTRGGKTVSVYQSHVTVGDILELAAGAEVPADGIFICGDDPTCNEAKMTGESKEIEKDAKHPFLLAGTEVQKGQLTMLVVAVGINSSYGRILASLIQPIEKTPLQEKLEAVAEMVGKIGGGVAIFLFLTLVGFWAGSMIKDGDSFTSRADELIDFFITAVTIVVVAVPEGLPLAVTVSLAYSMKKMVKDNNMVRVLSACETMGNATTICSDKTGTLTQNKMTVMQGWLTGEILSNLEKDELHPLPPFAVELCTVGIVVNSKAAEELDAESGKLTWKGNQTEVALMQWMRKYNVNIAEERTHHIVHKNYPFDSMKKNSSIIVRRGHGWRRYFKGAAEQLFLRCEHVVDDQGREADLAPRRAEIQNTIDSMTKTGLRTIAFSYQDFDAIDPDPKNPVKLSDPPEGAPMVFFGVVGIKDPLRPESAMSVQYCQQAGVVVRMVTGDHPETAKFIAKECGILTSSKHVIMTGEEFRMLMAGSAAEAEKVIPYLRVLARSKPEDKQTLVRWLKNHGQVVAATGDGTNDAPALKEAHVGIAMNIVGTQVAKAAAQILILDDNFHSVVKSIMWGRSVFDNIRKFVQFQLTVNVVALSISVIGAYAQFTNPLKPVQLLWVNLIMDTMAAIALGTEVPTMALLNRRPYSRDAPLMSKIMWRNVLGQSAFQLAVLMVILFAGSSIWDITNKSTEHYTLIFNAFVFMQIFNEINSRKVNNEMNVFQNFFSNYTFLGIILVTVVFQVFMVELFGTFAKTTGLTWQLWLSSLIIGIISLPWGFCVRLLKLDETEGMVNIPADTFHKDIEEPQTNRIMNVVRRQSSPLGLTRLDSGSMTDRHAKAVVPLSDFPSTLPPDVPLAPNAYGQLDVDPEAPEVGSSDQVFEEDDDHARLRTNPF